MRSFRVVCFRHELAKELQDSFLRDQVLRRRHQSDWRWSVECKKEEQPDVSISIGLQDGSSGRSFDLCQNLLPSFLLHVFSSYICEVTRKLVSR